MNTSEHLTSLKNPFITLRSRTSQKAMRGFYYCAYANLSNIICASLDILEADIRSKVFSMSNQSIEVSEMVGEMKELM